MDITFVVSLVWIVYGIVGICGFQIIPANFKGHDWTKDYIRSQGISSLMIGISLLVFDLLLHVLSEPGIAGMCFILLALIIPSVVFSYRLEKKYAALLKNEKRT